MEKLDDLEAEERFRVLHERINKLQIRIVVLEHKQETHDEILAQQHDRIVSLEQSVKQIGRRTSS